ncbi:hypothetical protein EMCRGX_G024572 [Ephydatia muelleri]
MATESGNQNTTLWLNSIPLECGIIGPLQFTALPRFSYHQLRKLISYARSKEKNAYPWMSYSVWLHIAKNKLHLSDELAWLYFETFDVISDIEVQDRIKLLEMIKKCSSPKELDHLRRRVSVDTLKFILFLYVQNVPHISLKMPMISGDEWPSPEAEGKKKSSEDAHLSFFKTHLREILQLLSDSEQWISVETFRVLEFLISGSPDGTNLYSLVDLALLSSNASDTGFSKDTQMFPITQLEHWLHANLSISPFGPHAIKSGTRDKKSPCYRSDRSIGRVASNILLSPTRCRTILLHKVSMQTLAKCDEGLHGNHVYIQNCRGSSIYLLAPLRAVYIEKCSHCLLVLGAVETAITVNNCDSITIVAMCRRLHISSSSMCTFHILTATRPVILAASLQITFAPYNTHYPALEKHMQQCGLMCGVNYWNQPLCLGTGEDETKVWCTLPPEDFRPYAIPFKLEGDTKENPCPVPPEYLDALAQRRQRTAEWYKTIEKANLSEEQVQKLKANVKTRFQEWLDITGHSKEISDLESSKHAATRGKPSPK